jgi:hypothetical protein
MIAVPAAVPPAIEGVALEQYAGVSAAIIEGFPLPVVLESEGLDAGAWPRVSLRWSQRLAKDGAGGPLAAAYRDTLAFARGWLGRRVAPLDDDLAAWLSFLNAWSAHPAPFDLLDELDLLPSDVSRIQGAWAQRIEKDEELRKQALQIAKKRPSAVPKVTVTKAELRPFPWTKKQAATVDEPVLVKPKLSSSFIGDAFGLERYAALHAEIGLAKKGGAAAVLAKQALDEAGFAALEARWKGRFAADPTLAQDFRRLVRYYEAKLKAGAQKGERAPAMAAPVIVAGETVTPPRAVLVGTALALDLPQKAALPFVEGAAPTPGIAAPLPEEAAREARPAASFGGTALAVDVPRGPATPFEAAASEGKEQQGVPAKLAGTALAVDAPRGPALPFVEGAAPTPGIAAPLPGQGEAESRPPAKLGGTALAVDVPQTAVLPFVEEAARQRKKFGKMSLDLSAARDSVEAKKAEAASGPPPSAAAPALTLEQHASMTVEIAMAPDKAMEVLARYGLTAEGKRAVDGYWREKVAGDAGVREAWERAYRAYWEWVVASRRRSE